MGWFSRERGGISWRDQTLDSISPPPLPLMVFTALVMTLLYFESVSEFQERMERRKMGMRFGLLLLPVVVMLVANLVALRRRVADYGAGVLPPPVRGMAAEDWGSAVKVVLVLVLLLVLVQYQPKFQSAFRCF